MATTRFYVTEIHVYGPEPKHGRISYDEKQANGFVCGGLSIPASAKHYSYDYLMAQAIETQQWHGQQQNGTVPTIIDHWKG